MDIMTRRAMMPNDNYIKNGLRLWLDGIDKGNVSGAWVDKSRGLVFENVNGFTNGSNYVGLDGSQMQYFKNNTFGPLQVWNSTIEVVISDYSVTGEIQIVFVPRKRTDNGAASAFGIRADGSIVYATVEARQVWSNPNNAKIFSIANYVRAKEDGDDAILMSSTWAQMGSNEEDYNYIGMRNYTTACYFTGKIHAIRIYNRYLTKEEMLHNQRIDNKRFKLGLNI